MQAELVSVHHCGRTLEHRITKHLREIGEEEEGRKPRLGQIPAGLYYKHVPFKIENTSYRDKSQLDCTISMSRLRLRIHRTEQTLSDLSQTIALQVSVPATKRTRRRLIDDHL
uniref:Uncharacterized protein n=1 Tax=Timema poppense TaxID=170557 RepID=A0A7R9GSB9_TIMPO|nr:unnamed protein product [Timema poppensis]